MENWVSKAELGVQSGYRYFHQNIPGDEDMSGMDIYVVAGKSGSTRDDVCSFPTTAGKSYLLSVAK